MASRRSGIGTKVNAAIVATLMLGFGAVVVFFGWSLLTLRERLTRDSLLREASLLGTSVENFMLPGEAPIAVAFFNDIAVKNTELEIALYRRDGSGAFTDQSTAEAVNRRIGRDRFPLELPRPRTRPADPMAIAPAIADEPRDSVVEADELRGGATARIVSIYRPLLNQKKCMGCHGSDHAVRGVVRVSSDISAVVAAQRATIGISGGVFFAIVALVGAGLARFMRRAVVVPVTRIGQQCRRVASGDFTGEIEYYAEDEIGDLARTVNEMTGGLRERSELSKYVSGSTLSALGGDQRGKRERRALLFSDVRGFTAFSERRPAEIVVEALNRLLDAQSRAVIDQGGDVDKFVGDQIVAVFSGADSELRACRAAAAMHRAAAGPAGEAAGQRLSVGAGIAAGDVIHGMIGSSARADYTVIGDAVNIAARLCGSAKPGMTIVHASAARAVIDSGHGALLEGPFRLSVRGKADKQVVYLMKDGGQSL